MKATATIDISTPTGRKIIRELEKHKKTVKISYPLPEDFDEAIPVDEAFDKLYEKLNAHYGCDLRKL